MLYYFVDKKNLFQAQSEMLLLNILPIEISNILKGEHRTIADQYDEVSILFADVVQFTPPGSVNVAHGTSRAARRGLHVLRRLGRKISG